MTNLVIDRIQSSLAQEKVDAAIMMSPESTVWASNVHIPSQSFIRERLFFVVVPKEGRAINVFSSVVEPTVLRHTSIKENITYKEHYELPMGKLIEVLKENNITGSKIWLETDYLPALYFKEIQNAFPNTEFIDCGKKLNALRVIKTPAEIALLQRLSRIAEQAFLYGTLVSRAGDTELQVADSYTEGHIKLGMEGVPFRIMGVGPINSRRVFNEPTDETILEPGDLVYADYVATYKGYYSDSARMAVVQKPTKEQSEVYHTVRDVQRGTISAMRVGMTAGELYDIASKLMEDRGHKLVMRSIGHSIGTGVHEHPNLIPNNPEILVENSVINVELDLSIEGLGKFHLEDTTLLTSNGAVVLSDQTNTDEMFIIR